MFGITQKPLKNQPARSATVSEIAKIHAVGPQTVHSWIRRGCPATRPGRGKPTTLNPAEVAEWMQSNGLTGKRGRQSLVSPELVAARLRKENALASKYELQVQRERGELVPLADVKRWIGEHVTAAKNKLIGLGASVAPVMEGRSIDERTAAIDAHVNEILEDLSQSSARFIAMFTGMAGSVPSPLH